MGLFSCQPLESRRLLAATTILSDGFDGSLTGWKVASQSAGTDWAVEQSGFGGVSAHSGQYMGYAAGNDFGGDPQNPVVQPGTDVVLYHAVDLTGYSNAFLSFWYNIPSLGPGSQFQVTVVNTVTGISTSNPVFTSSSATTGWQQAQVNISSYAGSSQNTEFFYSGSGGQGVYLDDVSVYTYAPTLTTTPTATLPLPIPDETTANNDPVTFDVKYASSVPIESLSVGNNIQVLFNGNPDGDASFQSMQVNGDGSIDATYSFLPLNGQWDDSTRGTYSIDVKNASVLDTDGDAVAGGVIGTFNSTIPGPIDISVSPIITNDVTGPAGTALPKIQLSLFGSMAASDINYAADIYIADAESVSANAPGQLIGELPFSFSPVVGNSEVDLDPSSAGLTIPANLAPGTYVLGVHVIPETQGYSDPDDSNNWAVVGDATVQAAANHPTIVTVMVLYTSATADQLGGQIAVQQKINSAIATANTAFLNSNINVQLQLVYSGEIFYTESGDIDTDLSRLQTPGDGFLDQAQSLRNQYAADLVSLWTATETNGTIGEAYIAGATTDANLAYSVVVATQMDDYTFAHEIGHNFGAGHAAGDSSGDNTDQGLYSYSHGYRFSDSTGDQFHDIMSYPPGTTIPYYSNPNVDYLGIPTGTAQANNALTISEDAASVANYRTPPRVAAVSVSSPSINLKGSVKITATGVSAGTQGGNPQVTFYRDYTGTGVFSLTDPVIGIDKKPNGGWMINVKAKSLPAGNMTIFAVVSDSTGASSAPVKCTLDVIDQPPVIKKFTAKVARNNFVTLAASASDADGSVTQLIMWVDSNGNDLPDSGEESFKGKSVLHTRLAVQAGVSYTFMAIAYDNNGVASAVKQVQFVG